MKKIFFVLVISTFLFSCAKDPATLGQQIGGNATLEYKIDGSLQEYSGAGDLSNPQGVIAFKQIIGTDVRYAIQSQRGVTNLVSLSIVTDSLKPGSYKGQTSFTFIAVNGADYGVINDTQILNIAITRNSGGTIDGIFSGNLYWLKDSQNPSAGFISVSITEGSFKNIRMIY